ncbi:acyltransferase [Mediterraneibacter glycyrrhizinilyticus]|uniref:acyltransferase family protein n=1 Tax=Mediterraneibacter glycyrrhizinilyticus TaxID=342942 RepID=UPI000E41EFBC|nr:acyltransferase [Lachnospiraceae bacterium]RGC71974.1 acyltransferase [Lachnospiraceae bacterium AM23-2LB]
MDKKRNVAIDLLRVIAATLIVLHHYQQGVDITFEHIKFYGGTFNFAYLVELFFLISGVMVYKSVLDDHITFKEFMSRRTNRIIPLLAISVFVETILRYINDSIINNVGFSRDLLDIVINALGLQSIGLIQTESINQPTWYLSVLLLCYVWLFVCTKVSERLKIDKCYMYLFMMGIGIVTNTYMWNTLFLNRYVSRGYFSFFAGVLLADYFERVRKNRCELASLMLPVIFLGLLKTKPHFLETGDFYFYTLMLWIPVLILVMRWIPNPKRECRTLSFLGKVSFGVYIWNEPMSCVRNIVAALFDIDLCKISTVVWFVVLSWAMAILSYLLIEKPFNSWLKRKKSIERERNESI